MPLINVLSPHVADMIAAGEVVERPASAVKELLENAVDAGARTVRLEIRSGGRGTIRVTDDGCGMAPEDAGVCFLRHATSKLHDEHGLEAIGTLGFRGEALAAISAVSRITMTTRARGAATGVRMEVIAGEIESMEETGCPEGTTIDVRDLFFNTPARQKFMGSDRTEGLACVQTAMRTALGHPEVSFRCLRDGQEEFFSPGDGKTASAVYALLGREFAQGLLPVDTENDGVTVRGFVSAPAFCRGNRGAQYFFCNGRPIRSRSLQAALEQAYKNSAMVGKFPACVLYVTLPNGLVDVNVHPTKAEVKFAKEKPVFDGVYYGTLSALGVRMPQTMTVPETKPAVPAAAAASVSSGKSAPRGDFFRSMSADEFREKAAKWEKAPGASPAARTVTVPASPAAQRPAGAPARPEPAAVKSESPAKPDKAPAVLRDAGEPYRAETRGTPVIHTAEPAAEKPEKPAAQPAAGPEEKRPEPEAKQHVLTEDFDKEPIRYIGEAMRVYILLEQGDKLMIIDKHAAHERLLFDRMRLNEQPLMSQELLMPETLNVTADGAEIVEKSLPLLERLGFELEPFGDRAFAVRAVPADIDAAEAVPLLEELTGKLMEGRSLSAADVWERLAATVACKAAIKGGWVTQPEELIALAERVLSGEVKFCPHGRPVMTVLTRTELDKRFGRIV